MLAGEQAQGTERQAAQDKAVDLILRLWSRRHDVPGNVHPLKQFEDVIAVLRRLRSDAWPYRRSSKEQVDHLLTKAFDGLRLMVAHGIVLTSNVVATPAEMGEAEGFLEEDEKEVVEGINAWIEFLESSQQERRPVIIVKQEDGDEFADSQEEGGDTAKLDLKTRARETFTREIDDLIETLSSLKAELGKGK
jgi:hypothetical protein